MTWTIERVEGAALDLDEVLEVYRSSGLGERRPADDRERMAAMVRNANLVLIARESDGTLVGIARSVSDFSYVTYLSDIAVSGTHQRSGIGRALIDATRKEAPTAKIVLLSAPAATEYYPHIGFTAHNSAWVLNP
ncbi:GNAT family N-acetyltransferase [Streptomyces sp. ID01-12c]|uniref:GNAT family N-acetyltransferase n=1 Tax=Streptomyces caniscabiei TaxID=2746961 RepID=A0A927QPX9_9ACTN|nr:GNAT family N-acetyltransferase [Streptomyces caniscabiei]MBD9704144.1 GNAT family N-acetyltransferase [Streptomyces caniscabiei]MBD9729327.1 GNAT family N-acetyltransferase [Streptomyces caniscabiei]MDX3514993.1 GNAT family N-acetyltransferase [Streptomyces caniscabiei]MDX3724387.1 GNAT family N-acetyltransferase [Streptomyces caniscabiei]MDX3733346.1 GNAT family N-acetyltransferase [Streptomyces caniscabiei]